MQTIQAPEKPGVRTATRKAARKTFSALLLVLTGVLGLNIYVFSHAPRRTPHYGLAEVRQIFDRDTDLDALRPARLD